MRRVQFAPVIALGLMLIGLSGCGILAGTTPAATSWQPPPVTSWQAPAGTPSLADVSAIAEAVKPSVVLVSTNISSGSGWIIDSSGMVITNQHVVDGAVWVSVTLNDHRILRATSWQSDEYSDLAVIHLKTAGLPACSLGTSAALLAGETVIAIGNSLGQGVSVKMGKVVQPNVAAIIDGRTYTNLIQSDTSIYDGDSGGPLVNLAGQVVGITNAGSVGTGSVAFAVGIDAALPVIRQLIDKGKVDRPYLGISGSNDPHGGVLVRQINPGSPAARAGLAEGDIITAADDKPVATMDDLSHAISVKMPGEVLSITCERGGAPTTVSVTLAPRPPDLP